MSTETNCNFWRAFCIQERAQLASQRARTLKAAFASGSIERVDVGVGVGWVPEANPFQRQWHATPLIQSPTDKSAVTVDLSKLQGLTPLAARLAWVLFDEPDQTADTCCPGHAAQVGRAVCMPGNCPLYSATSELPANPFCKFLSSAVPSCFERKGVSLYIIETNVYGHN